MNKETRQWITGIIMLLIASLSVHISLITNHGLSWGHVCDIPLVAYGLHLVTKNI